MVSFYEILAGVSLLVFFFTSSGRTNSIFLWFLLAVADIGLTLHFLHINMSLFALLYGTSSMLVFILFSQYYRMLNSGEKTSSFNLPIRSIFFVCLLGLVVIFQFSNIRTVYGPSPLFDQNSVESSQTWLVVELLFYLSISLSIVWGLRTYWLRKEELNESN